MDQKLFFDNEIEFMKYELVLKYRETSILYELFETISSMNLPRFQELQMFLMDVQNQMKRQLYDKQCHDCAECNYEMVPCMICGRIYKICSVTFRSFSCTDCESLALRDEDFMETDDNDSLFDLFDW